MLFRSLLALVIVLWILQANGHVTVNGPAVVTPLGGYYQGSHVYGYVSYIKSPNSLLTNELLLK